jgi:AcrR family transcriptional regulator
MPATKDQIADTFAKHVERFGFGKASVEDVAAELGISKRTIYQHFSGKKDLYAFVVDRIAVGEEVRLRDALAGVASYRARMDTFQRLVLTGMRAHIVQTTRADWMQEFEIAYDAMARAYGSIGVELVEGGAAAGEFSMADGVLANALIGAMVTEYGKLVRDTPGYSDDEAIVAAVMRMLGEGSTSKAAPRARRVPKEG